MISPQFKSPVLRFTTRFRREPDLLQKFILAAHCYQKSLDIDPAQSFSAAGNRREKSIQFIAVFPPKLAGERAKRKLPLELR
jgi:hypothetical protein